MLLAGCVFFHPPSSAQLQDLTFKSKNSISNDHFFDSTFLIQGIFVKTTIYLPEDYKKGKKNFPVIYIINLDSNNVLSNELTDTVSRLSKVGYPSAILIELKKFEIGFDDADVNDLSAYILNTKEYIDKNFSTQSSPESNIIVGYRQAAPVAIQLTLNYPELFGRSGIFVADFSPFPGFEKWIYDHSDKMKGMMFLHSYEKDNSENGTIVNLLMNQIGSHSKGLLYNFLESYTDDKFNTYPSFIEFYKWILSNGHNYIIHPNEKIKKRF